MLGATTENVNAVRSGLYAFFFGGHAFCLANFVILGARICFVMQEFVNVVVFVHVAVPVF